jgi:hypothetical protein
MSEQRPGGHRPWPGNREMREERGKGERGEEEKKEEEKKELKR